MFSPVPAPKMLPVQVTEGLLPLSVPLPGVAAGAARAPRISSNEIATDTSGVRACGTRPGRRV
ncbi:MAG: hypothetical protein DMD82_12705 [Candidatus Rokuibacteriota bacterium]|nr:MAG: hypothetical protein DMD82_12705 [Candidatus Rokubacteria bacterium]